MTPERWQRTEELYHAARAHPPAARAAFLAEACGDDEALRRDVESLLSEPASDAGFLAAPVLAMPAHLIPGFAPAAMAGRTLGGYQLQSLLGAGGMGEVYRARDPKLGRDVAIKILTREFTSSPDRLARFEREARTLAALNHPNICAIYGLEHTEPVPGSEQSAVRFLILELIDGDTLASKLERSRGGTRGSGLPLPEALAIARQIADALESAHERGIVHRDLKPANISITADGVVKVLDFGLAKVTDPAGTGNGEGQVRGDTREGLVIGTAAYMSPEQARGLPIDRRTDIWAFGCVLYEILTGRVAFAGETVSDSIARVLEHEPDWSALPAATPASIRRVLFRSLAKDPKKRLRDIGDVRIEIDAINEVLPGTTVAPARAQARAPWVLWAVSAGLALGLIGTIVWSLRPAKAPPLVRFSHPLPPGQTLNASRGGHIVALSPDGTQMVYSGTMKGNKDGEYGLYLRSMNDLDARVIPGTERYEATEPVFSPDGRSLVFFAFADGTLKTIAATGGIAQTVCAVKIPMGISWGPDRIVFGQGADGISRVSPVPDSTPDVIVRVKNGESAFGPQILPGGEVLFTVATGEASNRWDVAHVVVQPANASDQGRKEIIDQGSDARYLPTGHLVYAVSGMLYAVAFDAGRLKTSGERVSVVPGVRRAAGSFTGAAAFAVSGAGTLAFVPGLRENPYSMPRDLGLMTRTGEVEPLNLPPGFYGHPSVSPEGHRVAFNSEDARTKATIYTYSLAGGQVIQPLTTEGDNRFPVWASEARLSFQSNRGGSNAVWWQPLEGGQAEPLTRPQPGTSDAPESWYRDTLLYSQTRVDSATTAVDVSLWTLSLVDRTPRPFNADHSEGPMEAVYSHDGRWVAYTVTKGRKITLYVQQISTGGQPHPLTVREADTPKHPRWSPDGTELCYDPNVGGFECVRVTPERFGGFSTPVSLPKKLYMGPPGTRTNYDIMTDGRFVGPILAGDRTVLEREIQVVLNWFEELRALVPRR